MERYNIGTIFEQQKSTYSGLFYHYKGKNPQLMGDLKMIQIGNVVKDLYYFYFSLSSASMFCLQTSEKYDKLVAICLQTYKIIKERNGYKSVKSFFGSQAYNFFQELIHLHCKEINELIRNIFIERQGNMESESQNISLGEIDKDQKEVSSWKNLYFPEELWQKLQRLIKFNLESECKNKNSLQLQNIELEIQCSLNYSCPKCMIKEQKECPRSMGLIEVESDCQQQGVKNREPQTMKLIEEKSEVMPQKDNHKLQNIFDHMRRQRQKHIEMRKQYNRQISKWWQNIGNLMDLEKQCFDTFKSISTKKEELFKQMYFRNITNERMINRFCQKINKKSHRKLARSLSIKCHQEGEQICDQNEEKRPKLYSMKQIKKQVRVSPNKKRNPVPQRNTMTAESKRGFKASPAKKFDIFHGTCLPMQLHKVKIGHSEQETCHTERSFRLKAIDRTILLHN